MARWAKAWTGVARFGGARLGLARRGKHWRGKGSTGYPSSLGCPMVPKQSQSMGLVGDRQTHQGEKNMEAITVRIEGIQPLLMHNGQLADPCNEHTQLLSDAVKVAKKSKTNSAWEKAYMLEFMGGLYLNEKGRPCIPGEMLEALICEGAKKSKQGKEVKAGVIIDGTFPLEYKGPADPEALWKSGSFKKTSPAKVGQNRVMRTRPMFTQWALEFVVNYNPEIVNKKDLIKHLEKAGAEVGLGDWRPRYGRFQVVS